MFKMAFFWVFENDNILVLNYTRLQKSGISPQQKLGSLQNLKFIRGKHQIFSPKDLARTCAHELLTRGRAHDKTCTRVFTACVREFWGGGGVNFLSVDKPTYLILASY